MGPLSTQLGTGEGDLPRRLPIPRFPSVSSRGTSGSAPVVGPLWLLAPHDGTVSVVSTHLWGVRDHIVLPYTHTFIMNAGRVAHQIDRFLRSGRFERDERSPPDGAVPLD